MIFTIQNLGFAIGGFLLEGWLAFAARCVCALVLLALGAVARALLRKKIFPKLLAHSWHFEATGILLRSFALPAERMVWLTGIYFALASRPFKVSELDERIPAFSKTSILYPFFSLRVRIAKVLSLGAYPIPKCSNTLSSIFLFFKYSKALAPAWVLNSIR